MASWSIANSHEELIAAIRAQETLVAELRTQLSDAEARADTQANLDKRERALIDRALRLDHEILKVRFEEAQERTDLLTGLAYAVAARI